MTGSDIRGGVSSTVTGETLAKRQSNDDDNERPFGRNDDSGRRIAVLTAMIPGGERKGRRCSRHGDAGRRRRSGELFRQNHKEVLCTRSCIAAGGDRSDRGYRLFTILAVV